MTQLLERSYSDLDAALTDLRTSVQSAWTEVDASSSVRLPPPRTRHYLQLVIHEWVANLVRHATFSSSPQLIVRIEIRQETVCCEILDNSDGFDPEATLHTLQEKAHPLPEAHMGLRIIDACSSRMSYKPNEAEQQRFTVSIPYDHDPWMNVLF